MNQRLGKAIRTTALILVGMAAAMNVLGGIGTTCAAFFTKKYPPMWSLMDYQWLYQLFVVVTLIIGLAGVWTTIGLVKGRSRAYLYALIVMVAGAAIGLIHYIASEMIRGKSAPANVVFFINAGALIVLLLLRLPSIRQHVDLTKPAGRIDRTTASGLAAIVCGIIVLTIPLWAGDSHTFEGTNWVLYLQIPLIIAGGALTLSGLGAFALVAREVVHEEQVALQESKL